MIHCGHIFCQTCLETHLHKDLECDTCGKISHINDTKEFPILASRIPGGIRKGSSGRNLLELATLSKDDIIASERPMRRDSDNPKPLRHALSESVLDRDYVDESNDIEPPQITLATKLIDSQQVTIF
jgi:hypothetical protein